MRTLLVKSTLFVKRSPFYTVLISLCMLLAYGFYATHYTYHIDQLVSDYYDGVALVSAGRFMAPLIHLFTNWMDFSPFWHTTIMCGLLFLAGILWATLFQEATKDNLSNGSLFVFVVVFSSFPLHAHQLTYPVLNIALAYILIPSSLWLLFYGDTSSRSYTIKTHLLATLFLALAIDLYESFAPVFLVGLFAILLLESLFVKPHTLRSLCKRSLTACVFLLNAILLEFLISKLACFAVSGSFVFWHGVTSEIGWGLLGIFDCLIWLIRTFTASFLIGHAQNLGVFLVILSSVVSFFVFLTISIRKRNGIFLLLFFALVVSLFSLSVITGFVSPLRTMQSTAVYFALLTMLFWQYTRSSTVRITRTIHICILCILVLLQTQAINNYSVRNYERYNYEESILREVASVLSAFSIDQKAVIFLCDNTALPDALTQNSPSHPIVKGYLSAWFSICDSICSEDYYQSLSDWYGTSITCSKDLYAYLSQAENSWSYSFISHATYSSHYTPEIYHVMQTMGLTLIQCTPEQYAQAQLQEYLFPNNAPYSVTEQEEYIVVIFS